MTNEKNESKAISLKVTEGLKVTVLPNSNHEFLMTTKEVAAGYGISSNTIRGHLSKNPNDFVEGKHYVKGVAISNTLEKNTQPHQIYYTKRGIVRLGFFIKSDRARLFRDWAEDLIINQSDKRQTPTLPITATYTENQLFLNKLGEGMTYCYYTNGVLFTKLSPVFKLFGSAGSVSPTHKERIGMENLMQIEVGKQLTWFGNINAIEIFLKYAKTQIKYSAISTVYRDIFGIERSRDIEDPYVYHFTSMQMLEIFELIFDKPINKEKVISKLRCGKLEAGYEK